MDMNTTFRQYLNAALVEMLDEGLYRAQQLDAVAVATVLTQRMRALIAPYDLDQTVPENFPVDQLVPA